MRNFARTLVKFSKFSLIQTTIWRPRKMAPPAGPFVTPLVANTGMILVYVYYFYLVAMWFVFVTYCPFPRGLNTVQLLVAIPWAIKNDLISSLMRDVPLSECMYPGVPKNCEKFGETLNYRFGFTV